MSTLDFSPAPGPAPARRRIAAHAGTELRILLRNGEQLLLALVIPIGLLVAGHFFGSGIPVTLAVLAPSVLALAIWSTCFTSLAIMTGFERRDGVLERLVATPLGASGLIAGKALAVSAVATGQVGILSGLAAALGWRPVGGLLPTLLTLVVAAVAGLCFAGLALILAGTLKAEVTLALANLVYLVGLAAGIMIPAGAVGTSLQYVVWLTPTGALGEALRGWSAGDTVAWALAVVSGWALIATVIARKVFRWMS